MSCSRALGAYGNYSLYDIHDIHVFTTFTALTAFTTFTYSRHSRPLRPLRPLRRTASTEPLHQRRHFVRRDGAAEQVALEFVAIEAFEQPGLLFGFHAFGHDAQLQ